MPQHDIIVIGASLGGVGALKALIHELPGDLPATICIVIHMAPTGDRLLHSILSRAGGLLVSEAIDGEPIRPGHVYLARPDHHLLVEHDRIVLGRGPRENHSRPAVDVLFRSAATTYGPRVIGVVLTGRLDDGSAGLWAVKRAGGIAIVQDPDDAEVPSMPANAKKAVDVDHCVPLRDLASLLTRLVASPTPVVATPGVDLVGVPVLGLTFTCPDCRGPLSQVQAAGETIVRFRCHVGHAYSVMSLLAAQVEAREELLWTVVRSLEDESVLTECALKLELPPRDHEVMRKQADANKVLALHIRDQLILMPGSRER